MKQHRGLIYMHIPKTAGTSLNNYLASHYPQNEVVMHIEHQWLGRDWLTNDFDTKKVVTGHLNYARWQQLFDVSKYVFVTLIRDPRRQLLSQMAWLLRLSSEESRLEREGLHPAFQRMIARLSETGPLVFLESLSGLEVEVFDNPQSRQLLPLSHDQGVREEHFDHLGDRLASFDLIGLTEHLQEFALMLAARMKWRPATRVERLNMAKALYYKPLKGSDGRLEDVLEKRTFMDQRLYKQACKLFDFQRDRFEREIKSLGWYRHWQFRRAYRKVDNHILGLAR